MLLQNIRRFDRIRTAPVALAILGTLTEVLWLVLRGYDPPRRHLVETIVVYVLASLVYTISVWVVLERPGSPGRGLLLLIAAFALLFRLTVWPLLPALSDDVFRYRWEGKVQYYGGNPYQVRPNDPEWAHLRDPTFALVPGRDFPAGYGPLIEHLQAWTYRVAAAATGDPFRQAFWYKAPAALFDLGVILALAWLLPLRGLPPERVLIYAWSPLPVMEFWATGHNDSLPVLCVVVALAFAARVRWTAAFAALSLAAAAKLWPLVLLPAFLRWNGRGRWGWRRAWPVVPVFLVLWWPYRSDVEYNIRFMSGFVGGWRNNDSVFGLLLWLAGDIYRAKYTAFALIAAAAVLAAWRCGTLEKASLAAITALLVISANVHPWYLTWLLPLLVFHPVPALLLWTALVPLAYHTVIPWVELGEWHGSTPYRWWIYVPVYAMLVAGWLRERLTPPRSSSPRSPAPPLAPRAPAPGRGKTS